LADAVFPFLLLAGLTAALSTAVQAMKATHAARAKNMFWLEIPVSAQQTRMHRQTESQKIHIFANICVGTGPMLQVSEDISEIFTMKSYHCNQ
jgi:hypothetical protein